jgi:hypothetical protein
LPTADDESAVAAPAVRLIGESFLDRGLITAAQLAEALAEQQASSLPLGEILVARGWVTRLALAGVLSEHWEGKSAAPTAGREAAQDGFDLDRWIERVDASPRALPERQRTVVFAQTSKGYRLIEWDGTTAAVGEQLQVPDGSGRFVVTRVSRSPVIGDRTIYIYVEQAVEPPTRTTRGRTLTEPLPQVRAGNRGSRDLHG